MLKNKIRTPKLNKFIINDKKMSLRDERINNNQHQGIKQV